MEKNIETERLILRPFQLTDSKRVTELAGEKIIADMTSNIPYPYELDMAEYWIGTHSRRMAESNGAIYAITLKGDDTIIGAVSIPKIEKGFGSLGYWLGIPYWGRGIAFEASYALIDYCKRHHELRELEVIHLAENKRSKSVIDKLGVTYIETKMFLSKGEERETCIYRSRV